MRQIDIPARSSVRLTVTARATAGLHQWEVRMLESRPPRPVDAIRLAYGSQIGGCDLIQHIDIPPQTAGCTLEIGARHAVGEGWAADQCSVENDTPNELRIGFGDLSTPGARHDDVLLSFAFAKTDAAREAP